ncbi:dihydrofolate synthetase isoform X1 [Typha latifolia]|uniref:dihydrofolate synthetase isoform X1 n=1 Tax=Typha latifolia TaxID=4733 RepID=UPI003C2C21CD
MLCLPRLWWPLRHMRWRNESAMSALKRSSRSYSAMLEEDKDLGEFLDYLDKMKNYERVDMPKGAGTDSDDGFDLGRMTRLLDRLNNPHTHFKVVHVAGTKGKGSTAAFLTNILREQGYVVGCYSSPHLLTIRERISIGRTGNPVSAKLMRNLFHQTKEVLDKSIELENGALTHFEVFTALAFLVFSQEKVDIAIIEAGLGGARDATNVIRNTELAASIITSIGHEHLAALGGSLESIAMAKSGIIKHGRPVVIGGPLKMNIEQIIRDRASLMESPVISAYDAGIQSTLKCFGREDDQPYQTCDIFIQVQEDNQLFISLGNIKLHMFGTHQLQNAITATCTALCLRNQGWMISDASIRAGLEQTQLLGRSQFLTQKEASGLGLYGVSLLVDGAHTDASAKALSDVIRMTHPNGPLALVVAMASDKDHVAFARELLSVRSLISPLGQCRRPDVVLLTEVNIAGGKSRALSASSLKDAWIRAAQDLGINFSDRGLIDYSRIPMDDGCSQGSSGSDQPIMIGCQTVLITDLIKVALHFLRCKARDRPGLIVVTGSLHLVSSLLQTVYQ